MAATDFDYIISVMRKRLDIVGHLVLQTPTHDCFDCLVTKFIIHHIRSPVDSPHKGPVMRKMFPFDDVIMQPRCTQE